MKKMHRMVIIPAEGGHEKFKGASVEHHMREMRKDSKSHSGVSMEYSEPETHVFGESEGHKMLTHLAEHMHVPESEGEPEQETEEPEGEEEA